MSDPLSTLAVVFAIVIAVWLLGVAFLWLHRPSRTLAAGALRLIPDVARLSGRLLRDRSTPLSARIALAMLIGYLILPIDLVPDFVPGLGQIDDVVVAALVLRWVGRRVGRERLEAEWAGTPESFAMLLRLLGLAPVGPP